MKHAFAEITAGLVKDYGVNRKVYEGSGMNEELKRSALEGMANALQLQELALRNELTSLQIQSVKRELNDTGVKEAPKGEKTK